MNWQLSWRCFRKAGFVPCGQTRSGLVALQLLPDEMPEPAAPLGAQLTLELTA